MFRSNTVFSSILQLEYLLWSEMKFPLTWKRVLIFIGKNNVVFLLQYLKLPPEKISTQSGVNPVS